MGWVSRGECRSLGDEIIKRLGLVLFSNSKGLNNGMDGKCQEKLKSFGHEVFVKAHSLLLTNNFSPSSFVSPFSK